MLYCQVLTEKLLKIKKKYLVVENELKKLKTFISKYFIGKSHFEESGAHNHLVFLPISRYFRINGKYILSWKSKGLSD